ncbi:MAG: hypothetical protein IIB94_09795 [Candidatus Marinimicrobia bacterium]|nr:hypothetical protein [Candidatus Neomarinimicrobiota bacterium]
MSLSAFVSLIAIILGATGTILGILNFKRDKAKVKVTLQWDMKILGNPKYDENKSWGIVTVVNIGRRPIFISHASIKLPRGFDASFLIIAEGMSGKKFSEGDPPETFILTQEDLGKYSAVWKKLRATVIDSTGKEYHSKKVIMKNPPSWVSKH